MKFRIKALRLDNGINQAELGKILGVGKTTVSNYETGYSTPDAETLIKIADYFNVSTDYILGRTEIAELNVNQKFSVETLTESEMEILDLFRHVKSEKDQYKLIGRFEEIISQMTGDFKSCNAPSTRSKKNVG